MDKARTYLQSARDLLDLAEESSIGDAIMSDAILAAIAYGDALTVKFGGIQNTADHDGLPKALAQVIGKRADEQLARLARILSQKDDAQYGHRAHSVGEARDLLKQVERFAQWAEIELVRR